MSTGTLTVANKLPRPNRQEDLEPWYRQFWPWFLIALPGSVVIAGLSTVYIANRYSDDLVVRDYYKDGLAINVELGKQRVATELGIEASLQILDYRVQVRATTGASDDTLDLFLSHPLEADQDFRVSLRRIAPGLYAGELQATVAPNWHWTLQSEDAGWRLDGALTDNDFIDGDRASTL